MRILFLDNDGVICLADQWGNRDKRMKKFIKETGISEVKEMPAYIRLDSFDTKAVKVLNEVLEKTGGASGAYMKLMEKEDEDSIS